ncbi:hypothetical protein GCM10009087_51890 [Sphingomonas oligophenolica]|uniref:PepSY domain-containing protein n=1 Tax=Sphingomonas oligophenolica TaxID=301154 RepID=A0ABU9Y6T8_9SPHN
MKAQTQRQLRKLHHYVGVFFAPAILFFALSGAVQTFRLGEEKGWGGTPPAALVWMTSVHKDQALPRARAEKPAARPEAAKAPRGDGDRADDRRRAPRGPSPLPLKIFVVLLALGLTLSTALGLTIALTNRATRRMSILLVIAGTVLPLLLLVV